MDEKENDQTFGPHTLLKSMDLGKECWPPTYLTSSTQGYKTNPSSPYNLVATPNDTFFYPLRSPTPPTPEWLYSRCYGTQYMAPTPNEMAFQHLNPNVNMALKEAPQLRKSESDLTFKQYFPQASGSNALAPDLYFNDPSPCSSPDSDSLCNTFRTATDQFSVAPSARRSIHTQTERSFFEEKFLLRECILLGCEVVEEMALQVPEVAEKREYAEYIREKTIQSHCQNVCGRLLPSVKTSVIMSEYVTTFMKIADCWLDARNCFGTSDQCLTKLCSLDSDNLSVNYIEWAQASRNLLTSIKSGLVNAMTNKSLQVVDKKQIEEMPQPLRATRSAIELSQNSGPDQPGWPHTALPPPRPNGSWGHFNNLPCHCYAHPPPLKPPQQLPVQSCSFPPAEPPNWFPGCEFPFYQNPPRHFSSGTNPDNGDDYMIPSSYDVPRTNMTHSQKRNNISTAKSIGSQYQHLTKGYVIALVNNGNKRENFIPTEEEKETQQEAQRTGSVESPRQGHTKTGEWLLTSLQAGEDQLLNKMCEENNIQQRGINGQVNKEGEETQQDSDSDEDQGRDRSCNGSRMDGKPWKNPKLWPELKRRRFLPQRQAMRIQEVGLALWDIATPDYVKYPVKNAQNPDYYKTVKHPIFLETISNKTKNNVYETVEQFVHDCRRLVHNASIYSQKSMEEMEQITQFQLKFEAVLDKNFEQYQNWTYITGDPKEASCHPELRYANSSRKKSKQPKSLHVYETVDYSNC